MGVVLQGDAQERAGHGETETGQASSVCAPVSRIGGHCATGVTRQMFYNYLAIGLIVPGGATPGGRNLYAEECLTRIDLIRRLNRNGYTLRDIREIFMRGGQ